MAREPALNEVPSVVSVASVSSHGREIVSSIDVALHTVRCSKWLTKHSSSLSKNSRYLGTAEENIEKLVPACYLRAASWIEIFAISTTISDLDEGTAVGLVDSSFP